MAAHHCFLFSADNWKLKASLDARLLVTGDCGSLRVSHSADTAYAADDFGSLGLCRVPISWIGGRGLRDVAVDEALSHRCGLYPC